MPEQQPADPSRPKRDKPKILDLATGDPMGDVNRQIEEYNNQVRNTIKMAFKPLVAFLEKVNKMVNPGGVPVTQAAPVQAAAAPAPPPAPVSWSEMLQLNITFADNANTPLYNLKQTLGTGQMGKAQETMVNDVALQCIRECAIYTAEFPPPSLGPYAGRAVQEIMDNVGNTDLQAYLRFVKAFPAKYVGHTWKISETFTTWLINNSPSP